MTVLLCYFMIAHSVLFPRNRCVVIPAWGLPPRRRGAGIQDLASGCPIRAFGHDSVTLLLYDRAQYVIPAQAAVLSFPRGACPREGVGRESRI